MMAKKLLVILLSALLLGGSTEIHQLLKFPFLIQHYLQHRKKDSVLSIIEFLRTHYTGKDHPNDNDDNEDNRLPFKSTGDISHTDTPMIEKKIDTSEISYLQEPPTAYYSEGILNHRSLSIFHPPRLL
jgi:hypothetical protein